MNVENGKVRNIGKHVRVTAKTLRDVVVAIRFIRDTVANIATNAAKTRTADDTANASISKLPLIPRSNAFARWDGLDPNAINVRTNSFKFPFFFFYYLRLYKTLSRCSFATIDPGEGRRDGRKKKETTPEHIWITSK